MQLTLTVTESPDLPADVLLAFAKKAKSLGKTGDQYLLELISAAASPSKPKRKGAAK